MTKICKQCNKCFSKRVSKCMSGWKKTKFCSTTCFGLSGRGKPKSEEMKKKLSLTNTGKKLSSATKKKISQSLLGKTPWNKGMLGYYNKTKSGITTPMNHRIRGSQKYKEWRKSVFERDDYTCQMCGKRGGELNADHIKPFSVFIELRFDINNGRTLCIECHRRTPTFGNGAKKINYNKEFN